MMLYISILRWFCAGLGCRDDALGMPARLLPRCELWVRA
jgi:hypothetical protein